MNFRQLFSKLIIFITVTLAVMGAVRNFVSYAAEPSIRLETRVLGQNKWHSGSKASLRVITLDHLSGSPLAGSSVQIGLADRDTREFISLYTGHTDSRGTLDAPLNIASDLQGEYILKVVTQAMGERDEVESPVQIKHELRVLLTTDKPVYQPGQIIHIRALALRIPSLQPVAETPCTLEVMDAKGNKVFKRSNKLSRFGITSAEFQLASEINQGSYTIRAIVDKDEVEKKVTVERYVLPKFKIKIETDKKFYLPGEVVKGTIHADYFFGKPVDGGKVVVKLSKFDVGFNDFAVVNGTTDKSGVFQFEEKLPSSFEGQPLEQGNAFFKAEVSVTDGADHTEKATSTVSVAKDPLKILIIPEGGMLVPNVENVVYVVVSYPDGSPAKVDFTFIHQVSRTGSAVAFGAKKTKGSTNALGITEVAMKPGKDSIEVAVIAEDRAGHSATAFQQLGTTSGEESLLLRTDKAVSKVGQQLRLTVLSSKPFGFLYLDAVKDGQTILTKTFPFAKGKGEMNLPLTSEMAGTLQLHAYRISRVGGIIRDSRTVYVNPANDLHISISADKKEYLPGKPAIINFNVTDSKGRGLASALGVSIVDESVYALQELQPGLEKIYFMLEKELAEPKFEIHGITPDELVRIGEMEKYEIGLSPEKQQAARVLFAEVQKEQLEANNPIFTLKSDSYSVKIGKIRDQLAKKAKADYTLIANAIKKYYAPPERQKPGDLDRLGGIHYLVQEKLLASSVLTDQWGTPYDFIANPGGGYRNGLVVWSYGPDRRKETVDDIIVRGYPLWDQDGELIKDLTSINGATSEARDGIFLNNSIWFGEGFGGIRGMRQGVAFGVPVGAVERAVPLPSSAPAFDSKKGGKLGESTVRPEVRIRSYFPETLYFNPAVITDDHGKARINLDMADSITTWRLTAMGSSPGGLLGSVSHGLRAFQDFFIDIDLPVALTQNDEVSVPIAVYNYLPGAQKVELILTKEPWFELDGVEKQTLRIAAGDVKAIHYRIKVREIGWHKLTVHAYGSKMNDAISRDIEVLPDGQRVESSINDRLEKDVAHTVTIPHDSIPGAGNILVKVYPGIFSQLVEGMDSLLRMPFGCFEQTSSVTYPNVLVLNYMRSTRQSTPEIQMKAEQYINIGYQRLLSYECKSGGFEWFGNDPGNQVLTAYGLLEFGDMVKVYEVDPAVIKRTQDWLASKQGKDGSWTPDKGGIAEGAINRQGDEFRTTAYILWALGESGSDANVIGKGLGYLRGHWSEIDDAYALALAANAFLSTENGRKDGLSVAERLVDKRQKDGNCSFWTTQGNTAVSSTGKSADIETTALAALALIKSGRHNDVVTEALTYLIKAKDPSGTWGSTQATIFALKALIGSLENRTQDVNADVTVLVNGKEAGSFKITRDNSDVLRQIDCKKLMQAGDNKVEIKFDGKGSSLYQISSYHYLPWDIAKPQEKKLMDIKVSFDRAQLETDDIVTSTVNVAFNGRGTANMVIVDLGTPPGFDVLGEDLDGYVKDKTFQKYTLTGRQAIIYIEKVEAGKPLTFKYRLKAKFPIKAKTPKSVVYQYYNPDARDVAPPAEIVVK